MGNKANLSVIDENNLDFADDKNDSEPEVNDFEPLSFQTINLVKEFWTRVNKIIPIENKDKSTLTTFVLLSDMLEKIWMNGQYLMNITMNDP